MEQNISMKDKKNIKDILWDVKNNKIRVMSQQINNDYELQREKFRNHLVNENILLSIGLCKISYKFIFDDYLKLQMKTYYSDNFNKMELQKNNLLKKDPVIFSQIQKLLKTHILTKMKQSLDVAMKNLKYLLKFNAGLRKTEIGTYESNNDSYSDLYFQFCEFDENHFQQFMNNLMKPLSEDSIVFNDAQKQDEYYFIITYPEEYIMNKFSEYNYQNLSCQQRDQSDLFLLYQVFLEENNTNRVNKEDILKMMINIEEKQNKPVTQNPVARGQQNPFLQRNYFSSNSQKNSLFSQKK